MEKVNLSQLAENATVLVKNFPSIKDIKPFLELYYKPIFETAMSRMSNQSGQWPVVNSFKSFSQYFEVENTYSIDSFAPLRSLLWNH